MSTDIPEPTLQERCLALNLPGAAALAEHWSSPEQADLVGTYIKYIHPDEADDLFAQVTSGKSFSIQVGPFKSGEKPIDWLGAFISAVESFQSSPYDERLQQFDEACQTHVKFVTAPIAGPVTHTGKGGTFIIPAELYKRDMTDEELAPFRVSQGDPRLDY
jgi:hypothetical protein